MPARLKDPWPFFVGGNRDAEIRTRDLLHPKQARYQATLHPVGQQYSTVYRYSYFFDFTFDAVFFLGGEGATKCNSAWSSPSFANNSRID